VEQKRVKPENVSATKDLKSSKGELYAVGALLVVCVLLYMVGLDNFPFIDPSEAYYVEACREMIQTGDFITPHLNYQIYFSKPIINFWLIAASYKIFGLSEFAARLPFALLSTGLVFATYWFGRRLISKRAGFIAGLCVATSPLLLLVSRKSSIDIVFTFFLNLAVFATALAISKRAPWAWLGVYVALALGVLSKGPATLVLYGAGMAAFLVVARPSFSNLKKWLVALNPIAGFFVFLAVVLPWHLAVSQATEGLFLKVFFWYENLARFQGHTNFGQVRYWYYFGVLGYGFFPWVALLIPAVRNALLGEGKCQKANIIARVLELASAIRRRAAQDDQGRALILIASWALTTFAFFSISRTQLATYILPFIAPASILIAALAENWLSKGYDQLTKPSRFWVNLSGWLFAIGGVVALPGAIAFAVKYTEAPSMVRGLIVLIGAILAIGGVTQLLMLRKQDWTGSLKTLAVTLVAAMAIGTPLSFNLAVNKTQGNLKAIAIEAGKTNDKIAMYGNFMPSSMFYSRKPVDTFFHGHQLLPARKPPAGQQGVYPYVPQAILVRDDELQALQSTAPCPLILRKKIGEWGIYETPGYELESVKTLEDTFRDPVAFDIIVSGKSQTGPLTVPYATGKLYEKYCK
jgi:4-amino-4-deoxy-L-arabinose transferase-like glycosyltransferase